MEEDLKVTNPIVTEGDGETVVPPVVIEQPERVAPTIYEMIDLYKKMTGLQLDSTCHFDREFVEKWYDAKYVSGIHCKWAMKKDMRITHYKDGVIYKATNITDEIAERLMSENDSYKDAFYRVD